MGCTCLTVDYLKKISDVLQMHMTFIQKWTHIFYVESTLQMN